MDVNYGVPLKEYLLSRVTLLQIHRFASEEVQFGDALVSSAVVCFRKNLPPKNHFVNFFFCGTFNNPKMLQTLLFSYLRADSKWNGHRSCQNKNTSLGRLSVIF